MESFHRSELLLLASDRSERRRRANHRSYFPSDEASAHAQSRSICIYLDTTSPAKLIRYAVNLGLDCELALYLLNGPS